MAANLCECQIRGSRASGAGSGAKKRRLTLECDELWSYVGNKRCQCWLWLVLDVQTRLIVGCAIGPRTDETAQALWDSLPPAYRQRAVLYTDFWQSYPKVFPSKRHRPVGKHTGLTNHVERLNNTFRQFCARLVRKTLSFSKNSRIILGRSGISFTPIIVYALLLLPNHYLSSTTVVRVDQR